jgi:DNA-binding NarL/FixJ family response regulator
MTNHKSTAAAASVKKARVVILEDEPSVARRLEAKLQELGNIEPSVVSNMRELAKIVEADEFDAASIDWELHNVHKGPEAIELLGTAQPDAATVVNTKHEVEGKARHLKVDAFLRKDKDLDPFMITMNKAIRLGLARRISKSLRSLNQSGLPDLSPGREDMITEAAEGVIHDKARHTVFEVKLSDRFDDSIDHLTNLLQRRGWWEDFDVQRYTRKSNREKLKSLVTCAKISTDELSKILEVDSHVAETLNANSEVTLDSRALFEREDDLLSILAFVLRLSHYDPELVPHFWRVKNFYQGSLDSPPWDALGLSEYLTANGQSGLIESLTWIRSY